MAFASAMCLLLAACGSSGERLPIPPELDGRCTPDLLEALDARNDSRVRDLVRRGATSRCDATHERLEAAVLNGDTAALRLLLDAAVDPNESAGEFRGSGASLQWALERDASGKQGLDVARLLLQYGASPDQRAPYLLNPRTRHADDSTATYVAYGYRLLDATPLIAAAALGRAGFAQLLLDYGADPRAHDVEGRTALDYARERHDSRMVELLTTALR